MNFLLGFVLGVILTLVITWIIGQVTDKWKIAKLVFTLSKKLLYKIK